MVGHLIKIYFFTYVFTQNLTFAATTQLNDNPKEYRASSNDLIAACAKNPDRDDTCKQIILLNDFAQRFVEQIIMYSGIREYQRYITPFASVLITRKVTIPIRAKPYRVDATYNLDSKEYSLNFSTSF